jgi:hypothetical protein
MACGCVWEVWSFICHDVSWSWWGLMLWFEQDLEWWRRLRPSSDVVGWIYQGPNLRCRPLGQHMPPRVRYEMTCWLIRKALVSCLVKCVGLVWLYLWECKVQKGYDGILLYPIRENLSNYERGLGVFCCIQQGKTYGKTGHTILG